MKLGDYVAARGRGTVALVSKKRGVSYPTVLKASRGVAVGWKVAKAISEATEGLVTAEELCEGAPSHDAA